MRVAWMDVGQSRDLGEGKLVRVEDQEVLNLPALGKVLRLRVPLGYEVRQVVGHVMPEKGWWQSIGETTGEVVVLLAQTADALAEFDVRDVSD